MVLRYNNSIKISETRNSGSKNIADKKGSAEVDKIRKIQQCTRCHATNVQEETIKESNLSIQIYLPPFSLD